MLKIRIRFVFLALRVLPQLMNAGISIIALRLGRDAAVIISKCYIIGIVRIV